MAIPLYYNAITTITITITISILQSNKLSYTLVPLHHQT